MQHTDLLTESNLLHVGLNLWRQVGLASSNRSWSTKLKVSYSSRCMCLVNSTLPISSRRWLYSIRNQHARIQQRAHYPANGVAEHSLVANTAAKHQQNMGRRERHTCTALLSCRKCHGLCKRFTYKPKPEGAPGVKQTLQTPA